MRGLPKKVAVAAHSGRHIAEWLLKMGPTAFRELLRTQLQNLMAIGLALKAYLFQLAEYKKAGRGARQLLSDAGRQLAACLRLLKHAARIKQLLQYLLLKVLAEGPVTASRERRVLTVQLPFSQTRLELALVTEQTAQAPQLPPRSQPVVNQIQGAPTPQEEQTSNVQYCNPTKSSGGDLVALATYSAMEASTKLAGNGGEKDQDTIPAVRDAAAREVISE